MECRILDEFGPNTYNQMDDSWRWAMWPEIKKILAAVIICAVVGTTLGLILAGLGTEFLSLEFFIWVGVATFLGANVGLFFAYGFLPES